MDGYENIPTPPFKLFFPCGERTGIFMEKKAKRCSSTMVS
jgi:hypothetical protein